MSSTTGSSNSARYIGFDEYVDLKLQKTGATIKSTDIMVALAGVAAMFLSYLLVFVICDQWVVPGGFGIGLRWTLLLTLLIATLAWLGWKVGLPYLRQVNTLFAAREIEKADPELKSNLLNLVDLRAAGRPVDPAILRALEKNAAVGLQKVDVAQAIDHRPLMRIAYVLLAVVVIFCLYALFSPKKISNSIWRSLLPASNLNVATRTEIVKVQPGDITVLARETVVVTADIAGDVPAKVWVHFTTADGKFRDEAIELRTDTEGPTRFKGSLPPAMQDMTYVVKAGDATSSLYHLTVNQPPTATVDHIAYQFPSYMKLENTEQPGGQIDSWEGTKVTVTARMNIPVKVAKVEFIDLPENGPNGEEVAMFVSSDGLQLTASWPLAFRSDGRYAKLYQIQCTTAAGATDPKPIQYGLNIRPDLPPEVSLLEPVRDLQVPANAVVPMLIEARDPDFELSHINLLIKKNGQPIHKEPLSEGREQRMLLKHDLKLARLGELVPGDVVEIRVQAFDNKQPRPNSNVTPELKLSIVDRVSDKEVAQKLAEDQANRDQRLKEAQQDQNQAGDAPQQPREDRTNNDQQTDQPRTERDQPRQKPDQGPQQANNRDPKNQGEKDQGAGQNARSSDSKTQPRNNDSGNSNQDTKDKSEQPLSSDGTDDQRALEQLIQDELKQQNDKNTSGKPPSAPQNGADSESKPENTEGTQGSDQTSEGSENKSPKSTNSNTSSQQNSSTPKPGENSKTNQETKGQDQTQEDKNPGATKPGPNETTQQSPMPGNSDSTKPMPQPKNTAGNSSPEKANGTPEQTGKGSDTEPKAGTEGKTDKGSDPKSTQKPAGGASGKNDMPDKKGPMDGSSGMEDKPNPQGASQENPQPNPENGNRSDTKPPMKNDGTGGDPKKGPDKQGPMEGVGGSEDKPNPQGPSQENPQQGAGNGNKTESKPPKKNDGTGADPKGNSPNASGPEEQTKDAPNAQPKEATGNETGTARADNDSKNKATRSDNPDLKRDQADKPATRPGDSRPKETNDPARQASDSEVKPPKGNEAGTKKEDLDRTGDQTQKTQPGKNDQKRQGDPNAANEPKQGTGQKEQRSKTGSGGQGGTSKEDKDGDPGSKSTGQGDATNQAGSQQPKDNKSQQAGGSPKAGSGEKTESGGKPKSGGKQNANGGQKSEQGSANSTGGEKSNSGGEQPGGQGENGGQGQGQGSGQGEGSGQGTGQAGHGNSSGKAGAGNAGRQGRAPGAGQQEGPAEPTGAADPTNSGVEGDAANLDFKKQATELVLKRLQDNLERGEVDPQMLEKLGWTKDELQRFAERMNKHLQESKSGEETPESLARKQQFEEMLKSLDVNKKGTSRSGVNSPQREVNQIETRRGTVPKEYRSAYERFTRETTRQTPRSK